MWDILSCFYTRFQQALLYNSVLKDTRFTRCNPGSDEKVRKKDAKE